MVGTPFLNLFFCRAGIGASQSIWPKFVLEIWLPDLSTRTRNRQLCSQLWESAGNTQPGGNQRCDGAGVDSLFPIFQTAQGYEQVTRGGARPQTTKTSMELHVKVEVSKQPCQRGQRSKPLPAVTPPKLCSHPLRNCRWGGVTLLEVTLIRQG